MTIFQDEYRQWFSGLEEYFRGKIVDGEADIHGVNGKGSGLAGGEQGKHLQILTEGQPGKMDIPEKPFALAERYPAVHAQVRPTDGTRDPQFSSDEIGGQGPAGNNS